MRSKAEKATRTMDFDKFVALTRGEAIGFAYCEGPAVLTDSATYTNLGKLFTLVPAEHVRSMSFFIDEENWSNFGYSFFSVRVKAIGVDITIRTCWSVWQYSNIHDLVSHVVKPIVELNLQSSVDIDGTPWESERQFVDKMIELGEEHIPNQFKYEHRELPVLDGTAANKAFERIFGKAA